MASSGCLKKRFHNKAPVAGISGWVQQFTPSRQMPVATWLAKLTTEKTQHEPMRAQKMPER
jgi:hypothetical protein